MQKQIPKLSFLSEDSPKTKIFYLAFALFVVLSHLILMEMYFNLVTFFGVKYFHLTQQSFMKYSDVFDAFSYLLLFLIYFPLFRFLFRRKKSVPIEPKSFGISHIFGWGAAGISCLWFLLLEHVLSGVPFIAESLKMFNQGLDSMMGDGVVCFFLTTIFFAPILEEILFRGLVMNALESERANFCDCRFSPFIRIVAWYFCSVCIYFLSRIIGRSSLL